jgi:hypothetical protein
MVFIVFLDRMDRQLVDKMTVVVDRSHTSSTSFDSALLKTLLPHILQNYPETLAALYLFPTSTWFWVSWNLLKSSIVRTSYCIYHVLIRILCSLLTLLKKSTLSMIQAVRTPTIS